MQDPVGPHQQQPVRLSGGVAGNRRTPSLVDAAFHFLDKRIHTDAGAVED
jgi:hypothetical protein